MQRYASLSPITLLVVSVLAASLFFNGKTQAQLTNSDFSNHDSLLQGTNTSPTIPPGDFSNSTSLPGWTVARSDLPDSNVYLFTTDPGVFFLSNPAPGFNFGVQLDSSTGDGSQERFTQGASISTTNPFSLAPGTYQLSFYISTELGSYNGVTKSGTSGILVNLIGTGISLTDQLVNQQYTVTTLPSTNPAQNQWERITHDFTVASGNSLELSFQDSNDPTLGSELRSSNTELSGISIQAIPEPAPLTLIGVGVVSLVGFQNLLKRRRA